MAAIVTGQVDTQPYICVTMYDSSRMLLHRGAQQLLDLDIQEYTNDQVMNMQLMQLQTSSAETSGWFLSLTTSRGQLLNFSLYPEVYHKMVALGDHDLSKAILRFC